MPNKFLEAGSTLLKELDAPSSVAEFANVQATLESETKDTCKMEGGCLREFTGFLEKEVPHRQAHAMHAALVEASKGTHVFSHLATKIALHPLFSLPGPGAQVGGSAAGAARQGPVGVVLQGLHRHHQREQGRLVRGDTRQGGGCGGASA